MVVASPSHKVADFLTSRIEMSELTQREIAAALGYDKPNIITMIKQGHTKLPLDKVPAMAAALNVDPGLLMRMALREYFPGAFDAIIKSIGDPLTATERSYVNLVREVCGDSPPSLDSGLASDLSALLRKAS